MEGKGKDFEKERNLKRKGICRSHWTRRGIERIIS
jgi:hypothetical protein